MSNKYNVADSYKRKKYKNNFIKNVICRIDFDTAIDIEKVGPPQEFYDCVKSNFPIAQTNDVIARELQFGAGPTLEKQTKMKEWVYFGKDRDKTLKISSMYLLIEYTKYEFFDKLKEVFLASAEAIFKNYPFTKIKRLGLRYINSVELDGNPFNWNGFLSKNITQNIKLATDESTLNRVFSLVEFNYEVASLKFQYGIFNEDYPAKIKRKAFLLDYDMSTLEIIEKGDLSNKIEEFHFKIGSCFEEVITDKLRKIMEPLDE